MQTNLLQLSASTHHIEKEGQEGSYCGDVYFNDRTKSIQHYSNFYKDSTKSKVALIYDEDFSNYDYSRDLSLIT